jgi:hypothetical protein
VEAIDRTRAPAWAAAGLWCLVVAGIASVPWFDQLARTAGRPELIQLSPLVIPYLIAPLVAATVGLVVAARRPRHPVGWLLLGLGLSVSASGVADGYARYGAVARPGALPAARWAASYSPLTVFLALATAGFILLLTPDGHLPSRRWRWWARTAAAAPVVFLVAVTFGPFAIPPYEAVAKPLAVPALAVVMSVATGLAFAVTIAGLAVGALALVLRFRRARGAERLRLRWVAFAAAVVGCGVVVIVVAAALRLETVELLVAGICIAVLPLAIGAAVLRYRLYDLDRIISRTLAYAILTALLATGYAVVVLVLGQLPDRGSNLGVAVATLVVALSFQPLRRRVQASVDRRFNRRRHDAAPTIEEFSGRLRQQVDLDPLVAELLDTTARTMEPTGVSLWLRPRTGRTG